MIFLGAQPERAPLWRPPASRLPNLSGRLHGARRNAQSNPPPNQPERAPPWRPQKRLYCARRNAQSNPPPNQPERAPPWRPQKRLYCARRNSPLLAWAILAISSFSLCHASYLDMSFSCKCESSKSLFCAKSTVCSVRGL